MPVLTPTYSDEVLFPPLNFAQILPHVYRSGHPNTRNFAFMDTLNLRSIMYLEKDDYRRDTFNWAESRELNIFHHRIAPAKDVFHTIDEEKICLALQQILDRRNLPILIHDNKGRILPSVLMMLLRLINQWSFTAALAEYRAFLPEGRVWAEGEPGKPEKGRERHADLQFIDQFDLSKVTYDPRYKPDWLLT